MGYRDRDLPGVGLGDNNIMSNSIESFDERRTGQRSEYIPGTPQCLHLLRLCITFQREDGLVKRRLVNRSHDKKNLFIEGKKIWKNVSIFHSTAFSPRRQGNSESSYLELPTLEHVSKAFRIEIWFLTHSQGKYEMTFWHFCLKDLSNFVLKLY